MGEVRWGVVKVSGETEISMGTFGVPVTDLFALLSVFEKVYVNIKLQSRLQMYAKRTLN